MFGILGEPGNPELAEMAEEERIRLGFSMDNIIT